MHVTRDHDGSTRSIVCIKNIIALCLLLLLMILSMTIDLNLEIITSVTVMNDDGGELNFEYDIC